MQTEDDWTEFYSLDLDNRRRARRVNQQIDIRYVFSGQAVCSSVALNLSSTGARLLLNQAPAGETELTLQLADKVDVLARTVWEIPLAGGKRIAGVAFEGVSPSQRVALDSLLQDMLQVAA
jgi:hypothetical protein